MKTLPFGPPSEVHARLRSATAAAHRSLEVALDLLGQPADRERFGHLLVRFHGFHQAWEPAIAHQMPAARAPLPRLPLLERDLRALGLDEAAIRAIPACTQAARLGRDPDTALGSVYVLEGSTLGGRLITRHVARSPWYPPAGLRYFDPYGAGTAWHWRRTLAQLADTRDDSDRIVAGALRTFEILHEWLEPAFAS